MFRFFRGTRRGSRMVVEIVGFQRANGAIEERTIHLEPGTEANKARHVKPLAVRALVRNRAKASRQRHLPLLRYQRTYTTPSFGRITHPPIYYGHITRQRIMSPHNVITKTTGSTGNRPYSIPLAEGRFDEDARRRSPEGCARDWACCSPVRFDRSVVRVPMGSGRSVRAPRCPPERSAQCGGGYVDR